jgi:hypothetical protein
MDYSLDSLFLSSSAVYGGRPIFESDVSVLESWSWVPVLAIFKRGRYVMNPTPIPYKDAQSLTVRGNDQYRRPGFWTIIEALVDVFVAVEEVVTAFLRV